MLTGVELRPTGKLLAMLFNGDVERDIGFGGDRTLVRLLFDGDKEIVAFALAVVS